MRILVTGAAGYIATHTIVALHRQGHEVVAVDNLSNSKPVSLERVSLITGHSIDLIVADVRDAAAMTEMMDGVDCVLHFAGLKAVAESIADPARYYDNNVTGTLSLLRAMAARGVGRLVFSSSATVYGAAAPCPLTEDSATGPTNPYGRSKLMVEQMLQDATAAGELAATAVLRYFNPVGAHASGLIGEDPLGVPANLLPYVAQVAGGRLPTVRVFGTDYPTPDGSGVRDFIHVEDLAEGHVAALDAITGGEFMHGCHTWNLGTGLGTSVLAVINAFEQANGVPVPHEVAARRSGDVAVSYADPARANRQLGWQARRTLDDVCRDLWNWQTKNPEGY